MTVGLIDSGIDQDHPLFKGVAIDETIIPPTVDERGGKSSHGTAVAIVAQPNAGISGGFHGIAGGADLKMFSTRLRDPSPVTLPYAPISLSRLKAGDQTSSIDTDLLQSLDILNLSISVQGIIENYSEQVLRDNWGLTIATLAQKDAQDKTILVWAAGNAHNAHCAPGSDNCHGKDKNGLPSSLLDASSPEVLAGLHVRIKELRGHSIAVVATDQTGKIANFSNRCGIAAEWCLAAPGQDVQVAYFGPQNGSSGVKGEQRPQRALLSPRRWSPAGLPS